MLRVRVLRAGDEGDLQAFLGERVAESMFLLSNLRRGGIEDAGEAFQGTYVGAFRGDELRGVGCHAWNGVIVWQAPEGLDEIAVCLKQLQPRRVAGMVGPRWQVAEARRLLGLARRAARMDRAEDVFALDLEGLVVPGPVEKGQIEVRRPRESELGAAAAWRAEYLIEATGMTDGSELRREAEESVRGAWERGDLFLALLGGEPVAVADYNARLAEAIQLGGVYTPVELRGRGYGRAVVAGALLAWPRSPHSSGGGGALGSFVSRAAQWGGATGVSSTGVHSGRRVRAFGLSRVGLSPCAGMGAAARLGRCDLRARYSATFLGPGWLW